MPIGGPTDCEDVDVLVVGAGPAGACLAANLAPTRSVLLVDRLVVPRPPPGETLVPAARRLFTDMGLWDAFVAEHHERWHANLSIWGETAVAERSLVSDLDRHGWHIDRRRFDPWLREIARRRGARWRAPATVRVLRPEPDGWRVHLETETKPIAFHARLVVDATGRRAAIARRLGARRVLHDRLVARWIELAADRAPHGTSFVQADEAGWWYVARKAATTYLAFHTDVDLPAADAYRGDGALLAAARKAGIVARFRLDPATVLESGTRAAASGALDSPGGAGWLAVGDAATTLDPLAARGLFTALTCGLAAAEACDRRLAGDPRGFDDYQAMVAAIVAAHARERSAAYAAEARWPRSLFWRRRAENVDGGFQTKKARQACAERAEFGCGDRI